MAFTLDTYAHLIPSMEQVGAEQLQTVFSGILSSKKPSVSQRVSQWKGKVVELSGIEPLTS